MVDAALTTPAPGFAVLYGISDNTRGWWDLAPGHALGYDPQDDAEDWADRVEARPEDQMENAHVGGSYLAESMERRPSTGLDLECTPRLTLEPYQSGTDHRRGGRATGLTADTLRYYERDGLIVRPVVRVSSGHRRYGEDDIDWILLITRLRSTGMRIRDVRRYADLVRAGDGNEQERLEPAPAHTARSCWPGSPRSRTTWPRSTTRSASTRSG